MSKPKNHKLICLAVHDFVYSCVIGFFLATKLYSINYFSVGHVFLSFIKIS